MKKTLLVSLILLSGILLTACGKKVEENNIESGNSNVAGSSDVQNDDISSLDTADCEKTIENYLAGSDKEGKGEGIKVGDNIVVDYIGRLEDGTVFDTSIESIAKACGKYRSGVDYTKGFEFNVGVNQVVKGFDDGVIGMKLGQTKTVKFGPDEGYGQRNEEYVISYTKDEIGDFGLYNVGDLFQPNQYVIGTIIRITDKELVVDYNSELAGKDLIFDITIKSITPYVPVSDVTPSTIAG